MVTQKTMEVYSVRSNVAHFNKMAVADKSDKTIMDFMFVIPKMFSRKSAADCSLAWPTNGYSGLRKPHRSDQGNDTS